MMRAMIILMLFSVPLYATELSLADLQRRALAENQRIKSMIKESQMLKQRISIMGSLDDPKLKLGINNLPAGNPSFKNEDMTSKEIGISQMIPLWGKLSSKEKIALKEYQKSLELLRKEKADMLHMLRMNVYELGTLRDTMTILNDIKRHIRMVIESEVAASKAGMGNLSNVIKANIESSMIDEELIDLGQKERDAEQQIIYIMGSRQGIATIDLPGPDLAALDREALLKLAHYGSPELKIARLDAEMAALEVSLKQKEYFPDMEIGLSYMQRDDGPMGRRSDMISGMVTFNLPAWFWKKNAPMVKEMKKKLESGEARLRDTTNQITAKVNVLFSRLQRWSELYRLYRNTLVPQTELALEVNLARYKTSTVELMPIIDTMRMLLRYKKELVMSKKEYHTVYSELYALTGQEVLP